MATIIKLAQAHEIYSSSKGDKSEIRDTARNGKVIFKGTYRKCMAEAKKLGLLNR